MNTQVHKTKIRRIILVIFIGLFCLCPQNNVSKTFPKIELEINDGIGISLSLDRDIEDKHKKRKRTHNRRHNYNKTTKHSCHKNRQSKYILPIWRKNRKSWYLYI